LAVKGYVLYFLRDLILKNEGEKKKKGERRGNCITPTATLGFLHRARRGNGYVFFFVIELDVVVQANKEKGKRFLSMDVVDDVIDHLFCSVPLIYFEF
jgi:hypothetical protein